MKPMFMYVVTGMLVYSSGFAQQDSARQTSLTIQFSHRKINNPFYKMDRAADWAPFTIRSMPGSAISFTSGTNNTYRSVAYRPADMPIWKQMMTLASQLAISAYAGKRNLYYISPGR